jgi:tetratricopeptide (TPR) repeat protein
MDRLAQSKILWSATAGQTVGQNLGWPTLSLVGVGLIGLTLLGCGRTESEPKAISGEPTLSRHSAPLVLAKANTYDPEEIGGTARFLAPSLLTAPEIANAEPLNVPAVPCDYRQEASNRFTPFPPVVEDRPITGPVFGGSASSSPAFVGPSYSPIYDENATFKGSVASPVPSTSETIPYPQVVSPFGGSPYTTPFVASAPSPHWPTTSNNPPVIVPHTITKGTITPLPSVAEPLAISPELEIARRQADEALRRGFSLAERGALFSARSEFTQALRQIAQAQDATQGAATHTQALARGMRAIQEADDFVPKGSRIETQLPLNVLIASHQTSVLKGSLTDISPTVAIQAYHAYAQEQLALSLEHEPLGSLALFALAKIQLASEVAQSPGEMNSSHKAIALHRAATFVEPNNFLAANELGVLLARQGRWQEARAVLENSVTIAPQVVTYQNLANVYQHLGEGNLARQTNQSATELAMKRGPNTITGGSAAVQWLDGATFAQTSNSMGNSDPSSTAVGRPTSKSGQPQNNSTQTAQKPPTVQDEKRGASSIFPWNQPKRN